MSETKESEGIEVTERMIEAGMKEYGIRWRGLRDADDDVAREMLKAAFLVMYLNREKLSDGGNQTAPDA